METINGYTIIAERPYSGQRNTRVILGVRQGEYGFRYVTAVADFAGDAPTEWSWGHYFDGLDGDGRAPFGRAVRDFDNR